MGVADEDVVVVVVAVVAVEDVRTLVAADDDAADDDAADDVADELGATTPSASVWLKVNMVRRLPAPQIWLEFPAQGMLQSV